MITEILGLRFVAVLDVLLYVTDGVNFGFGKLGYFCGLRNYLL
jgi:hypothetical protein